MAASGYTPILLYASGTATNVPLAANMTSSSSGAELALNYADGKLYYKDSGGTVQVLATKASASNTFSAGSTGLTPSTATTGAVTLGGTLNVSSGGTGATTLTGYVYGNGTGAMTASTTIPTSSLSGTINLATQVTGTLPVANGGTGLSTLTAGYIPYGNGTSAFSSSANLYFDGSNLRIGNGGTANSANGLVLNATNNSANGSYIQGQRNGSASYLTGDTASALSSGTGYITYVYGANPSITYINGVEASRLDASGNLLVGTTSVLSAVGNSSVPLINAGSSGKGFGFYNGTNTYVFGGALGYEGIWFPTGAALRVYNGSSVGVYLSSGNTSWTGISDGTLKNVISQITDGLSAINGLKPKIYSWKLDATNKPYPGLIAQDVQTVLPNIVETETNGKLGIRYTDLIPYLISAIQELDSKFDAYVASHP